jgi:hypothetical protein
MQVWDEAAGSWLSWELQHMQAGGARFLHAALPTPASDSSTDLRQQQQQQQHSPVRLKLVSYPTRRSAGTNTITAAGGLASQLPQPCEQRYTVPEPGTYLLQEGRLRRALAAPLLLLLDMASLAADSSSRSRLPAAPGSSSGSGSSIPGSLGQQLGLLHAQQQGSGGSGPAQQQRQEPCGSRALPGTPAGRAASRGLCSVWAASRDLHGGLLVVATPLQWRAFQTSWRDHQHLLPAPDVVIAGAGTRVYYSAPSHWEEDLTFRAALDGGWDAEAVSEAAAELATLLGRGALRPAHGRHQSSHRLRLRVKRGAFERAAAEFDGLLRARGGGCRYSSSSSAQGSWVLWDIVPEAAGVGRALLHVQRLLGWRAPAVLASGSAAAAQQLQQGWEPGPDDAAVLVGAGEARRQGRQGLLQVAAPNLLDGLELAGYL